MKTRTRAKTFALAAPILAAAVGGAVMGTARADTPAEQHEQCAIRLSVAILGVSPTAALVSSADPQSQVDTMLADAKFQERFSRFVNSKFNDDPGTKSAEDAPYHLAKYVLQNGKAWHELFDGPYKVDVDPANQNNAIVSSDPNGLGYFRSTPWMVRYAGNEPAGIKISTAYHILNNVTGLKLVASTNAPGADITATGRQAPACAGCHYTNWYALDKTAAVLSKVVRSGQNVTFTPKTAANDAPQTILGNVTVSNDKELVTALLANDAFPFATCRLAWNYLYGRDENKCESQQFAKCMTEFKAKGTVQAAIAVLAKDPLYCQ